MRPKRTRLALAGALGVCVLALSAFSLASSERQVLPRDVLATPVGPVHGAFLGAYVQPTTYTQQGLVNAFLHFESLVGRPLTIVHVYHRWATPFPSYEDRYFADRGKLLLDTWGGGVNTLAVDSGADDSLIRQRAEAVKALAHPVLIEFRHEMDRPNLQASVHGPAAYIKAWDRIRAIFEQVGATNASFVWCPTGYGFATGRAQQFYPGNDEVDWICADIYPTSPSQSLASAAAPFLRFAASHPKPVLIGEFAGGNSPAQQAQWITEAGELARTHPQVKALVYFNGNGVSSTGQLFHYAIESNAAAIDAFRRLAAEPFFHPALGHAR